MKREEKVAFEEDMFIASEIPLIIDTYDDIFSDFDPRPYHTRALSDDFLYEARKATRDKKPEAILIKFLVPERIRSVANEILIRKRLKEHFRKHYLLLLEEHGRIKKRAISLIFIGMSMIVIASYMFTVETNSFLLHRYHQPHSAYFADVTIGVSIMNLSAYKYFTLYSFISSEIFVLFVP